MVSGAAYCGEFTNANGQVQCSLEEPVGNALPTNLLVFDGTQLAGHALTITNQINSTAPTTPGIGKLADAPVRRPRGGRL